MHPVGRQQDQHDEIRNQQRAIERVGVVETLKSLIQQMLAEIGPNALGGGPRGQRRRQDEIRTEQGVRWKPLFYRIRRLMPRRPSQAVGIVASLDAASHFQRMKIDDGNITIRRAGHEGARAVRLHLNARCAVPNRNAFDGLASRSVDDSHV